MATVFKKNGKGPWIIKWFDSQKRRHERSSRTTDKRAAIRIAAKLEADVALRRDGVVDVRQDRFASEDVKPLQKHIDAYLAHLKLGRRSPRTIADAKSHLAWTIEKTDAKRLSDLTLSRVVRALSILSEERKSPRTIEYRGGSVRTFLSWCVKDGRISDNPLEHLPKQNVDIAPKVVRRALTDQEIERLLRVAEQRGRKLWYMLALYAGLRLSELKRLCWSDIDLRRMVLTIRIGKAKRVDEVPLHPELQTELHRVKRFDVLPSASVFPTCPTNETRRKDFVRAGIALVDEEGKRADLQALRGTLGTMLARNGVAPQVAMKIMRHTRYSTTLAHYTHLTLADASAAMDALDMTSASKSSPHHRPHQSEHGEAQSDAS